MPSCRRISRTADLGQTACPSRERPVGGFTLLELLVVAAIIALLVAILLPALGRSMMRARVVQVHSDLRQITLALDAYMLNSRDKLPPTRFGCGTNVNYQLPVELARGRYLARGMSKIPQADFPDAFARDHGYKYRAPGAIYLNGTFFDAPDKPWKPRATIWVPDDFPICRSDQGRYYSNLLNEPASPVAYAVWSAGPDPQSPKFPRDEQSGVIDESRLPVARRYWLAHCGDTGLITHFRGRTGLVYMSP